MGKPKLRLFTCWLCYSTGYVESWVQPLVREKFCSCAIGQAMAKQEAKP